MQTNNNQKIQQQILFITDLEKLLGRNRLTLRRWWMSGKFPSPVKLHGTTLVWHAPLVMEWIDNNINLKNG